MTSLKNSFKGVTIWTVLGKLGEWGTAFAVFWLVILPKIEDSQDSRIEKYHKLDSSKVKFRTLLSQEFDVQPDRIHIYIKKVFDEVGQIKKDFYDVHGWITDEMDAITPRLMVINEREYWLAIDGEIYRVDRNEEGTGFYWYGGKWLEIYK